MGMCTYKTATQELCKIVREKLDSRHYSKIKEFVFTRVPSSRVGTLVEGVNIGFELSQSKLDLHLVEVSYVHDSLLFDITRKTENELIEQIQAIEIVVPKYSANRLYKMLSDKRLAVKREPWLHEQVYASLDKPLGEFFEWYDRVEHGTVLYVPRVLKSLRQLLKHPDVTPALWDSVIQTGQVHES